jgi:hypothetical protein
MRKNKIYPATARSQTAIALFCLSLAADARGAPKPVGHALDMAPRTVLCFTNTYSIFGTNLLTMLPATNQGVYYRGETVIISNRIATPIEVYNFRSVPITRGRSPLLISNLPVGHFWVQCVGTHGYGDRTQFLVLPSDYHPMTYIGTMLDNGLWGVNDRMNRVRPTVGRGTQDGWCRIDDNSARTNDWSYPDACVNNFVSLKYANIRKIWNITRAPRWAQTNDWGFFRSAYIEYCTAFTRRYGTNYTIELFNEMEPRHIWKAPTNDWAGKNWTMNLAMTVSGAVEAVRRVSYQKYGSSNAIPVWGLSWQDAAINYSPIITDPKLVPYWRKLDAITWHDDPVSWGPIDEGPIRHPESSWWNNGNSVLSNMSTYLSQIRSLYPSNQLVITEAYPKSPDALGRTNQVWYDPYQGKAEDGVSSHHWLNQPVKSHTNTWKDIQNRWIKANVLYKQYGVNCVIPENLTTCCNTPGSVSFGWYGWAEADPVHGRIGGPTPPASAFFMLSYWLDGYSPVTNYWSGNVMCASFTNATGYIRDFYWARETKIVTNYLQTRALSERDIYGQSVSPIILTEEPVLVDVPSAKTKRVRLRQ